jgi:chromosome segregation ATPase
MIINSLYILAVKSDVQVPTVPTGSVGTVQWIVGLVVAVLVAIAGGGAFAAYMAARTRKVRQYSDVREDTTIQIESLKAANETWEQIAQDAREQAKSALGELRGVIKDKDQQIRDQKDIIADYRRLLDARNQESAEARVQYDSVLMRLQAAENREELLTKSRDELQERLRAAEAHMVETTLNQEQLDDLRGGTERHGLHGVN